MYATYYAALQFQCCFSLVEAEHSISYITCLVQTR